MLSASDTSSINSDSNCLHSEKSESEALTGANLEPLGKLRHCSDLKEPIATKRKPTVAECFDEREKVIIILIIILLPLILGCSKSNATFYIILDRKFFCKTNSYMRKGLVDEMISQRNPVESEHKL
jgi:hypothetical protein